MAGSQLTVLKNYLEIKSGATSVPIGHQPYAGYRIEASGATLEMFEANWQASTAMLSSKGWFIRLTWGLYLLATWLNPQTFRRARGHNAWFVWFGLMLVLVAVWWSSAIPALLKQFGLPLHIGSWELGQPWFLALAASLLAAFGVSVTASVDVADLFRRYLSNLVDDNGLPTRKVMRGTLTDAVNALSSNGYDEIVLVAHSFGVLVALDAIAEGLNRKVYFVSLGGFLAFLAAENDWVTQSITTCSQSDCLSAWVDYYSNEDMFAAPSPVQGLTPRSVSHDVALGASLSQRVFGKAHVMYFRNGLVQDTIMNPSDVFGRLRAEP